MKYWAIIASFLYMGILFIIAFYAERQANKGYSLLKNPYIYALSLAVYCTAWTFYGSIGRAAENGPDFMTTYLGPTLLAPVLWIVLRKIIRICKVQRITSIADFVSARYDMDAGLGKLVTMMCVLGIIPYMSIQIKAISESINTISGEEINSTVPFYMDTAFYVAITVAIFSILFSTAKPDTTIRQEGLITAIAFESLFKLVAFIAGGIFVCYFVFDGMGDIFKQARDSDTWNHLLTIDPSNSGFFNWTTLNILSMFAFLFLPRQFHVAVKENTDERHVLKAMWLFPLYLLIINIFVLPIALGGNIIFEGTGIKADTYLLNFPLQYGKEILALFIYLGGFSAATGMIIVSTSALSIMISNQLMMPLLIRNSKEKTITRDSLGLLLVYGRRVTIFLIIILAYGYNSLVGSKFSLVSIGLISFVAVAQFAPGIIGGILWKSANKKGVKYGMWVGLIIWIYTLVIPTIIEAGLLPHSIMTEGPFGIELLRPFNLFGLNDLNYIVHGFLWSIFLNTSTFLIFSIYAIQSGKERNKAEIFVDIFKYSTIIESSIVWKGRAMIKDLEELLGIFLGKKEASISLEHFADKHNIKFDEDSSVDFRMVNHAEKLLTGAVGSTSARTLISSVVKEEDIVLDDVLDILKESQELIKLNKQLKIKSIELEIATEKLKLVNEKLQAADKLKNEFISTVTHEMRTPLTSIRAFSEIILDHDNLSKEEIDQFLVTITQESIRMERLISQVLDLEKFESGKQKLNTQLTNINDIINTSIKNVSSIIREKNIDLKIELTDSMIDTYVDRDMIIQVILNLLSNAIKFQNGAIKIISEIKATDIIIKVIDNGQGIDPKYHKLIFKSFYQASNQNIIKPVGSGLGLTISSRIIEAHQGEILVESKPDKGATFIIKLPVTKSQIENKHKLENSEAEDFNS
ncbi:sensor histidine kinase [Marinigracilibium pacificum]|uniref:histidine kinase n=1 Tax=Marinigracilibium pacificum TaxID=2729599 RepID=A0A848IWB7_9BACT|nr:sensor histidine kinase [Marinigracilibium pacificum]NMM47976.1 histidine kinase [Marinigracilibium pacificum]